MFSVSGVIPATPTLRILTTAGERIDWIGINMKAVGLTERGPTVTPQPVFRIKITYETTL